MYPYLYKRTGTCKYGTSVYLSDGGICRRSDAEEVLKTMLNSEAQSVEEGKTDFAKKFSPPFKGMPSLIQASAADLPLNDSPVYSPRPLTTKNAASYDLDSRRQASPPPNTLLSPAFTPPSTPGIGTPRSHEILRPVPVNTASRKPQQLLEKLPNVDCVVRARIPTVTGAEMFLHLYQNDVDNKEHLAIVFGPHIRSRSLDSPRPGETELDRMIRGAYTGRLHPGRTSSRIDPQPSLPQNCPIKQLDPPVPSTPLVRIHSECYTGETAWSARCDCGEQLDEAARLMSLPNSGGGVIVYLRQEGRGIGLGEKLKAYNLQDLGSDTVEANLLLRHPADARSYGLATAMLLDLEFGGASGIRLLTNNPDKVRAVEGPNREVVVTERVPMIPLAWKTGGRKGIHSEEIESYLRTKVSFPPKMFNKQNWNNKSTDWEDGTYDRVIIISGR